MHFDWSWPDFGNLIIIAIVTGLTMRLLLSVLKRWLGIEFPTRRVGALAGLIIGFIAVFRLSRDLKIGLPVSLALVAGNFVVVLANHFIAQETRRRRDPRS